MLLRVIRAFAALSVPAVLSSGIAMQASTVQTEKFNVPFAFHVQKQSKLLPAGEYQVQRTPGLPVAMLTNLKTGERVQVLSSENTHRKGELTLVFANGGNGASLQSIS